MTRSPTYAALGAMIGFTGACALVMGLFAAAADVPLVAFLPRGQFAAVALLYAASALWAALALWTQGADMVRALAAWAAVTTFFQLWFVLAIQVGGFPPSQRAVTLLVSLPFLALPWALVWYVRRERRGRAAESPRVRETAS